LIALLDTGKDLNTCEAEIGEQVGQLLTPLTRYRLRDPSRPWAIDNGGFSRFEEAAFLALLAREDHHKENCKFVCLPDVVGSARRTLEIFERWLPRIAGWRSALVIQDGQDHLPIPWDQIDAVFIGGTTAFKCGDGTAQIIRTAKILGKWVHVGRVNDPVRWDHFEKLGADSVDGTGIARYTDRREAIGNRGKQTTLELQ
jgi:hypothetical protein